MTSQLLIDVHRRAEQKDMVKEAKSKAAEDTRQAKQEAARHHPLGTEGGRIQSCKPCRKTMIGCDHGLPVCKRCIDGKIEDQCVYAKRARTLPTESGQEATSEVVSKTEKKRSRPAEDNTIYKGVNMVDGQSISRKLRQKTGRTSHKEAVSADDNAPTSGRKTTLRKRTRQHKALEEEEDDAGKEDHSKDDSKKEENVK